LNIRRLSEYSFQRAAVQPFSAGIENTMNKRPPKRMFQYRIRLTTMPAPPQDSALRLALLTGAGAENARTSSPIEEEVIRLFDLLRNRLLRYLMALGLDLHDGEEVIQEVFLALFQHLREGKPRENLRGWIFRVAHNLGLKRRYASRERVFAESEESLAALQPDPGLNPEEQMAVRQRQEDLLAVLRALPEQDRCCLRLRSDGMRYREIAEVLGISLGAVAASLERSLARLSRADERPRWKTPATRINKASL
jgi:RNA polymerase sigma-70 factor (ECF subfamily)